MRLQRRQYRTVCFGATTSALFPFALWSFALVPFALSSHLLYTSFALYVIGSIFNLLYDLTRHLLCNIKIHYKIAFIGIPERNLTMKCGIFFWKIRKLQFSSVLQSPSCLEQMYSNKCISMVHF